jgi:hypothetical protein
LSGFMRVSSNSKLAKIKYLSLGLFLVLILLMSGLLVLPNYQASADDSPGGAMLTPVVTAPKPTATATVTPSTSTPTATVADPSPAVTPTVTVTATVTVSPTPTLSAEEQAKKDQEEKDKKEKEEKEKAKQAALTKARGYSLTVGQPDPATIDAWLARCNSPQLQEATPDKTIGQLYVEMGWKYGINSAYALAFFIKESSCGTAGSNLASHNFGNIRWSQGYATLDNTWRAYPSWNAGMEDWFKLLKENYLRGGTATLADVVPTYAPESENDTTLYINQVMDRVDMIMASSTTKNIDLTNGWYCEATGFRVGWDFLDYWGNHGGVVTLGWPISDQEYENGQIVQYFERAVLEYHPENQAPYQILLRALGRKALQAQPSSPAAHKPDTGAVYFPETGYWLSGQFVKTWQDLGGLAQFGYPIGKPVVQGTLLIQWCERGRFELDLQQPDPQVMLGLVGREAETKQLQPVK